MVPFDMVFYLHSIVAMAVHCVISETKARYWPKLQFFIPPRIRRPHSCRNIAVLFGVEKLEWCAYPMVKKFDDMFSRFNRIPVCNRRMDKQSDGYLAIS